MDVIGGKWKPIILCNLRDGALRPSDLKRRIPDISQKMLTQQLKRAGDRRHRFANLLSPSSTKGCLFSQRLWSDIKQRIGCSLSLGEMHVSTLKEQGVEVALASQEA